MKGQDMPKGYPNAVETRAEGVRTERRRKPGSLASAGYKLNVEEEQLNRADYHYRFVNDKDGRLQQLIAQDYDPAPEVGAKADGNGLGTVNSAMAGVADGKPFDAVLMRKPKWMHEEDVAGRQSKLDERDEAIRRGATGLPGHDLRGPGVYTPGTGENTIERA